MKSLLSCLTLLLIGHLSLAQFVRIDTNSQQAIEAFITQQKAAERMVGVSVGIIRNGEVAYLKGFGYEDSLQQIQASEKTLYRLASISKSVTGMMAMRLIEQGRLDINKDIRDYVPEYPAKPEGTITSEELLSNESGVIHYSGTSNGQYCQDSYDKTSRDLYISSHTRSYDPIQAIDIFKNQKICYKPGLHYQYTTWGFCLMGAVLERAGGKSYEELLNEEVVCPLQLPTLQIEYQDHRPYDHEAAGYEFDGNTIIPTRTTLTDYTDVSYKTPGGGLISSVIDLTLIMKGMVNREFLSDSMVSFFGTRHMADDSNTTNYGYGTSTGSRNGDSLYWHSGSQAKTATLFYYSPENKNGVAIMCNTNGVSLFPLARLIYDYLPQVSLEGPAYTLPEQSQAAIACQKSGVSAALHNDAPLLYPNPVHGSEVFINLTEEQHSEVSIRLRHSTGQILQEWGVEEWNGSIPIQSFPAGVYFVEVLHKQQGTLRTQKLLIAD